MDPVDLIRGAQLPEATVELCLRGDLQTQFEQAEKDLAAAQRDALTSNSLSGGGEARVLAETIERLQDEMRGHSLTVRLRALPRLKFRALTEAHQPRTGDGGVIVEADRYMGINADTFPVALVRACAVEPVLDDDTWAVLLDERLTDWQFDQLFGGAWNINRREVSVPFSRAASRILNSAPE